MAVIGYLGGIIAWLIVGQALILRCFKEPHTWYFGANSQQPKSLKLALKILLQTTLIGSIFLFPRLIHQGLAGYYGPMFARAKFPLFFVGEGIALVLCTVITSISWKMGWIYWKPRFTRQKAITKSSLSALSSLTVVFVEEPLFRGVVLNGLLVAGWPPAVALPVGAVLFSLAHYIRKVRTYWPAVGLATLGFWLGVAYYKTGNNLWLPMGIHSGGILFIGVQRCFLNYPGSMYLCGTQTFPIAGVIAIGVMLLGAAITWFVF